ncbi:MAG: ATP-binding protein [bacterium]|nr:ATP-binding protein [bacterium]
MRQRKVLVVGDWFVDDHWVAGEHRSSTSSRIGKRHLRSLQSKESATESLCGAGRTASVLVSAEFRVSGVGICAEADEAVLLALLDSDQLANRNPHTLQRWADARKPKGIEFTNLGSKKSGTSRAIRIYEREGANVVLTARFDWETQVPKQLDLQPLIRLIRKEGQDIEAVVIKDLGKGLVRTKLVRVLAGDLSSVPWFVSTKEFLPSWQELLKDVDLRVFLIPELAARAAIGKPLRKEGTDRARRLTSWMVGSCEPSKGALTLLREFLLPLFPDRNRALGPGCVVVVADDSTVLALATEKNGFAFHHSLQAPMPPMPFSSVLLGALVRRVLDNPTRCPSELTEGAADFACEWRLAERRRATDHRNWSPAQEPTDDGRLEKTVGAEISTFDWKEKHEEWKRAFNPEHLGLVGPQASPRLELWRAMTELRGYICIGREKRRTVASLVQMLREFARSEVRKTESALLKASPGSGKSHLVKCLAHLGDFEVLRFDVSQLYRQEELIDCFDRISTTQAQLGRGTPLILFFDEVDSEFGGVPPYRSFLRPLEEGVYVRAEKLFHIRPAVWLFAASKFNPDHPKARDFRDRVGGELPLGSGDGEAADRQYEALERAYLGAATLKLAFPEIEEIKEDVLDMFVRLSGVSNRVLGRCTAAFFNVRQRRVDSSNIPWRWIEKKKISFERDAWEEARRRPPHPRWVRIVERPGGE